MSTPPGSLPDETLGRLEILPGDWRQRTVLDDATCVVSMVKKHWGIYGAGVLQPTDEDSARPNWDDAPHLALLVDPIWLHQDLHTTRSPSPRLLLSEAPWARANLASATGIELPDRLVLQASLAPQRLAAATGDRSYWQTVAQHQEWGTLGPPVTFAAEHLPGVT